MRKVKETEIKKQKYKRIKMKTEKNITERSCILGIDCKSSNFKLVVRKVDFVRNLRQSIDLGKFRGLKIKFGQSLDKLS